MKLSYNWHKTYVPHDLSPGELAALLTMSGLEVEDVETFGSALEGVVVGEVLETQPHPNADKLTLCTVRLGGNEPVQIVCGAPNVAPGQKVPVATIGTTLLLPSKKNPSVQEPITIQPVKIRGEVSQGMICAEDELGLSGDHSGIMVLDSDAELGAPFTAYLAQNGRTVHDAVLDVNITPNRPDAVSHIGIARDVSALADTLLAMPEVSVPRAGGPAAEQVRVEIRDPDGCGRYVAMAVRGIQVGESPEWLKQRLTAIGLRPRNNVVDVTNFVMYECGQPLHAFDLDRLAGATIIVEKTKGPETFTTLDSKERELPPGTLMICDAERRVAIAGIMGGENSEVAEGTSNVLIESAYFDPSTIRRTAKALGLATDASYRFERGVDPCGQAWAAARAAQLIAELAGGEIVAGMAGAHPRPFTPRRVRVRRARVAQLLGIDVPVDEVCRLLRAIGFQVSVEDPLDQLAEHLIMEGRPAETEIAEDTFICTVPTFRPDIEREVDVIEEIARLYGYHRIPEPEHSELPNLAPQEVPSDILRREARSLLRGMGFHETYTNSMLRKETADLYNQPILGGSIGGEVVGTLNPISQEMSALRPTLLPGLLSVMSFNRNHGQHALRFFEIGHVFRKSDRATGLIDGYAEHETLIIGLSGPHAEAAWDQPARAVDYFDLKGIVEALLHELQLSGVGIMPAESATPVTAYHARIRIGSIEIGTIARLDDGIASSLDLRDPVFFAELDWNALVALARPGEVRRHAPVSRFPVVDRDVAVVVDRLQPAGPLLDAIRKSGAPLLRDVSVFDLYEGKGIEEGKKSIAFALRFGSGRTLTDKDVDRQLAAILDQLTTHYGASLRQ